MRYRRIRPSAGPVAHSSRRGGARPRGHSQPSRIPRWADRAVRGRVRAVPRRGVARRRRAPELRRPQHPIAP
jgi:hypothetical protein